MEYIQVCTTFEDPTSAQSVASQLVESRQAACAQLEGPITSVYRWEGKIESEQERRLMVKTRHSLFAKFAETIAKLHKYDVPQIFATSLFDVLPAYSEWINEALTDEGSKEES